MRAHHQCVSVRVLNFQHNNRHSNGNNYTNCSTHNQLTMTIMPVNESLFLVRKIVQPQFVTAWFLGAAKILGHLWRVDVEGINDSKEVLPKTVNGKNDNCVFGCGSVCVCVCVLAGYWLCFGVNKYGQNLRRRKKSENFYRIQVIEFPQTT